MPRAIWSGAISFGLVSIPVKLFSAINHKNVSFNQLDSATNSRIRQKRVNAEGEEVPYDRIVKGYEVAKDSYVIVTDEELAALAPKASRMIDISDFVDGAEIDPVFYDSPYYLVPEELARKSYVLLCRAMEESNRVAIATFVMRTKQYLVAIRPVDGALMMSTMVYADEVVSPAEIPGLEELADVTATEAELALADQLIDSLSSDFEPERYQDNYRLQVLDLLEAKANGQVTSVEAVPAAADDGVIDLLAALEASVNAAKEARRNAGAAPDGEAEAAVAEPKRRSRTKAVAASGDDGGVTATKPVRGKASSGGTGSKGTTDGSSSGSKGKTKAKAPAKKTRAA
ncbi:MAG: Ku protein [Acidimicrobiia bacterium]|nr:Ku protein [Acidimicrobiia bacterium]